MKHTLISYLKHLTGHRPQEQLLQDQMADWRRDPLAHPDIRRMSERERADLQFNPRCVKYE